MSFDTLVLKKRILRAALRARRRGIAGQGREAAGVTLRDIFLAHCAPVAPGSIVAGYVARDDEINPAPLMEALGARGCFLALVCMENASRGLEFRAYAPGDALVSGRCGIPEPLPSANIVEPDILFVPLLGFDRRGGRLGQGGGSYDKTLSVLRARKNITAIGLAYAVQEEPEIPQDTHDQKLDGIVTEREYIACSAE